MTRTRALPPATRTLATFTRVARKMKQAVCTKRFLVASALVACLLLVLRAPSRAAHDALQQRGGAVETADTDPAKTLPGASAAMRAERAARAVYVQGINLCWADTNSSSMWTNGGLNGGAALGARCGGKVECEDDALCSSGCCVQKCRTIYTNQDHSHRSQARATRSRKGLCYCRTHHDCHSLNCKNSFCQMNERLSHNMDKERQLRSWHETLAHEEALDTTAVDCSSTTGACTLRDIDLAVVLAFPLADVESAELNLRSWNMGSFSPCRSGWPRAKNVDLVIAVAILGGQGAQVKKRLEGALTPRARECIRSVIIIDLKLTEEEDTYDLAPPAMFHAALNSTMLRARCYKYMFWMECDSFGVRQNWLEALYQLAVLEQGAWMVGSLQQHNRKMYSTNDYYHINGNALHRFDSEAYRMFLRSARLHHPHVFDYAIMIERMQGGAEHVHIGQQVTHRFVYTKVIQNHPADVCMQARSCSACCSYMRARACAQGSH